MTPKQFKVVIALLVGLIAGQWIQTALQMRSAARLQRSAESADMSAVDTMEITKEVRASLKARAPEEAVPVTEIRHVQYQ